MKLFALGLLVAALATTPAFAAEIGIAAGTSTTGSQSQVASASQGSSAAALIGVTAQTSQSHADNAGFGFTAVNGNSAFGASGNTGNTSQSGGAVAFGLAGSQNVNAAAQQGAASGVVNLQWVSLFAHP